MRRQFESNYPKLDKLTIGTNVRCNLYLPHDGDWERDGKSIGKNTNIKHLGFGSLREHVSRDEFEAFCKGLACNQSIERLEIHCCTLFGGEIFNMLGPFLEQNSNLRCLSLFGSLGRVANTAAEILSRFNTLKEFLYLGGPEAKNDVETLMRAVSGHSGMTAIHLSVGKVGGRVAATLAAMLTNPNSSVSELRLSQIALDDEELAILAPAFARNDTLKNLNLALNGNVTASGWRHFFTLLQSPHILEEINLWGNSIGDASANLLANAMTTGTQQLKCLNLCSINDVTTVGWQALFDSLKKTTCMLEELLLRDNDFLDEEVTYLSDALAHNRILRSLDLRDNNEVTAAGWRAFLAVLENPNSALEKVGCGINDEVLVLFASSLMHNSRLKELYLNIYDDEGDIAITNWGALSNVLCNKSSIDTTFSSNHTLQRVFEKSWLVSHLPSDLQSLFMLNRENTKVEAARRKILNAHFRGDFSMQPFIDMDLQVLPYAIAWMARDKYGSSLTYQFVRDTTLFVGVGGERQSFTASLTEGDNSGGGADDAEAEARVEQAETLLAELDIDTSADSDERS